MGEINGRFKKGQSGNPGGRPKSEKTIQELARAHCPKAIETLVHICEHGKTENARVTASNALLDRGYGRPPQFTTGDNASFRRAIEMSDDELATIASSVGAGSGNGIAASANGSGKPH